MVGGHHNMRNYIKGHSIRRVENHCSRQSSLGLLLFCSCFYATLSHGWLTVYSFIYIRVSTWSYYKQSCCEHSVAVKWYKMKALYHHQISETGTTGKILVTVS